MLYFHHGHYFPWNSEITASAHQCTSSAATTDTAALKTHGLDSSTFKIQTQPIVPRCTMVLSHPAPIMRESEANTQRPTRDYRLHALQTPNQSAQSKRSFHNNKKTERLPTHSRITFTSPTRVQGTKDVRGRASNPTGVPSHTSTASGDSPRNGPPAHASYASIIPARGKRHIIIIKNTSSWKNRKTNVRVLSRGEASAV